MSEELRKQLQREVGKVGKRPITLRTIIIVVVIVVPILIGVGILAVVLNVFVPQFIFQPPPPAQLESGYARINLKDAPSGQDLGTLNIDLYFRSNETYYKTVPTKTTFFIETRAYAYINITGYNIKTVTVHVNESSSTPQPNSHALVPLALASDITFNCLQINQTIGTYTVVNFTQPDFYRAGFVLQNTNVSRSWGDVYYALNGTLPPTSIAYTQQIKRAGAWIGFNTTGTLDNVTINGVDFNSSLIVIGEAWILPIFPLTGTYGANFEFVTDASLSAIYIFSGIIDNLTTPIKSLPP